MRRNLFASILLALLAILPLVAQTGDGTDPGAAPGSTEPVLIDGVAAVVGNEVILISDLHAEAMQIAQLNRVDPRDPRLLRDVLQTMIADKLVLARAREDSIEVPDAQVGALVERQYQLLLQRCNGSPSCLEQTYGMSTDAIRQALHDRVRQQELAKEIASRKFGGLKVTDADIQEFYNLYRDSLGQVPEQVELQRIVLTAKPSADARQQAIDFARALIDSLQNGADFSALAKRWSKDPGSAANGGDVGFVEPGRFVPQYENAARRLEIGQISDPVESPYGIHIIQVLDRRGEATRSRHIMIPIEAGASTRDSLAARLSLIRDSVLAGSATFAEMARRYSEDPATRGLGGSLGKVPVEQLPAEMKGIVAGMKEGEISSPQPVALTPSENGMQILRLARRIAPHVADPREDRPQLEQLALRYKQEQEYQKWVDQLRSEIYWEVKYRVE